MATPLRVLKNPWRWSSSRIDPAATGSIQKQNGRIPVMLEYGIAPPRNGRWAIAVAAAVIVAVVWFVATMR